MAKATSGWYLEVDAARQAYTTADGCTTVQVGPVVCAHLRACALLSSTGQRWTAALLLRWHTVDQLYWQIAFLQYWHSSSTQRWQAVDHAVLLVDQDVVEVLPPSPVLAPPFPVAYRPVLTSVSATGDEGSLEASPVAPASGIAGGRQGAKLLDHDGKQSTTGEQQTGEPVKCEAAAGVQSTGEPSNSAGGEQLVEGSKQLVDDLAVDKEEELSAGEESTDSDVVEGPITKPELRCT
ncbi:unnamed protein product, partial [Closterium sp. NIES-53]